MTAYFDEKHEQVRAAADELRAAEGGSIAWLDAEKRLRDIDRAVVWDVTICAEMPGFPSELRQAIAKVVLVHSVDGQPVNARFLDFETIEQHVDHIDRLVWELHDIFHDVGRLALASFSDDPRTPLNELYANGEELREKLAVEIGLARDATEGSTP